MDHDKVSLDLLLRHTEAHYTKYQLINDLDCVLALCAGKAARAEVRKFARAKLEGRAYIGPVVLKSRACESCRRPFASRRADARFCSAACRKRRARKAA